MGESPPFFDRWEKVQGIHPWYIVADRVEDDLAVIEEKIQTSNCLAVGECGLDKRIEIPFSLQEQVFRKQLALAQKYQKPVVIHCVASFPGIDSHPGMM
ncbi:hypothetical protein FQR65_LT19644 [Abscondita terminalis]|nr:hypothetical protein FQR65_LT19644 [Abscondita terminalis]